MFSLPGKGRNLGQQVVCRSAATLSKIVTYMIGKTFRTKTGEWMGAEKIFNLAVRILLTGHFFPERNSRTHIITKIIRQVDAVIISLQFIFLIKGSGKKFFYFKYRGPGFLTKYFVGKFQLLYGGFYMTYL